MKKFRTNDMKNITYVSWPAINNDGSISACVKWHADESNGTFLSEIFIIDNNTGVERCITVDGINEKHPVFSNDCEHIYFLSDQSGEWQVWRKTLDGSNADQITTLRHGVTRFDVNESAGKITFEATAWPEEVAAGKAFNEMTSDEKTSWKEELDWTPYVATDLTYKLDEWHGMRKGEFQHIGYIGLEGEDPFLIDMGFEAVYPSLSEDGNRIAFHAYPYSGAKGRAGEIFIYDIEEKRAVQLTENAGIYPDHAPLWVCGDKYIITAGFPEFEDHSNIMLPYIIDIKTHEYRLLIEEDITEPCSGVRPIRVGRSEFGDNAHYMAIDKGTNYLYFLSFYEGRGGVYKVRLSDPKTIESAVLKDDIYAFALAPTGDIVITSADLTRPAELFIGDKQLTHSNEWLKEYMLGYVTVGWIRSRDGKADLQYWVMTPPDYDPEKKYPAVFDAKGGPETCYGESFWHEFQALASEGLIVIYGNPRGSMGYGRGFNGDIICWRDGAMEDHLAILDAVIEAFPIDTDRLGFTGGSYGGYMTMKLLGRTDTFTAAVAQRALANPVTSYGTGDMGFISSRPVPDDFRMRDYLVDRAEGNIISYVDAMKTPLLILHAADDYRCGFEQAEQIFIPMHERNSEVPLRLIRFPGENHGLTRTGRLHSQMRHLKELVSWFRKYLIEEPWTRVNTGAKYGCAFENRVTVNGEKA